MNVQKDIDNFEQSVRNLTSLFATNYALTAIKAGDVEPDIEKAVQYGCQRMAQILRKLAEHLEKVA